MNTENEESSSIENLAYSQRQQMHHTEKEHIAREVANTIPDNSSIFINIGTSTQAVALALMQHSGLHIVTNDLKVAEIMSDKSDFEVIIAGGIVRARDHGIVGEATIDLINQFYLDFAVIGASGIDDSGALLDYDYREVRVTQAIIKQANRVLLVTDHSKFDRRPMVRVAHLSQIDVLFTDQPTPETLTHVIDESAVEVRIVE